MYKYPDTLNLNLYKTHFSYIHHLTMYTRSFKCKKCGKLFHRSFNLNRHEQTCEVEVKRVFPGGVLHVGQTVFQKMREFGIHVSEELRFIRFGQRLILNVILIIPICLRIVQKSTGWLSTKSSVLVYVQM